MITLLLTLVACFLTGLLTLISGFGLGTLLVPFFTLLYNAKTALFIVAIIHLTNNLFKLILFRKEIDLSIFKRFGLVSLIGALIGASLYEFFSANLLKKLVGGFLVWSGMHELLSKNKTARIPHKWDLAGGFFSGLLGGLIGSQGAIRSAYLLNYSLSKQAFIATGTAISILIDLTRLPFYFYNQKEFFFSANGWIVLAALIAALAGTRLGKDLLHSLSLTVFRNLIAATLIILGIYFFF